MYIKSLIILTSEILLCTVASSSLQISNDGQRGLSRNIVLFPGENGEEIVGYLSTVQERIFTARAIENVSDAVYFVYYSREYPGGKNISNAKILPMYFNSTKKTKVIIHGWLASSHSDMCSEITNAYLNKSDVNVIVTDWNHISKNVLYFVAAQSVLDVANYCAEVLDYLIEETNADPQDFHLIGHSLGAQIAGFTGRMLKRGKTGRITGLDPALPLFHSLWTPDTNHDNHLNPNDSNFVDIIHTCAGFLGARQPVGHVDFYPNGGGPPQPGCTWIKFIEACSHGRSWKLWKESILLENAFVANQCPSMQVLNNANCAGKDIPMGENTPSTARGVYFLRTSGTAPYVWKWNSTNINSDGNIKNKTSETRHAQQKSKEVNEGQTRTLTKISEAIENEEFSEEKLFVDAETNKQQIKNVIPEEQNILVFMDEVDIENYKPENEEVIDTTPTQENILVEGQQSTSSDLENENDIRSDEQIEVKQNEEKIKKGNTDTSILEDKNNTLINNPDFKESNLIKCTDTKQENNEVNIKQGIATLKLENREYIIKYALKDTGADSEQEENEINIHEGIASLKVGNKEFILEYKLIKEINMKQEYDEINIREQLATLTPENKTTIKENNTINDTDADSNQNDTARFLKKEPENNEITNKQKIVTLILEDKNKIEPIIGTSTVQKNIDTVTDGQTTRLLSESEENTVKNQALSIKYDIKNYEEENEKI